MTHSIAAAACLAATLLAAGAAQAQSATYAIEPLSLIPISEPTRPY